MSKIYLILFILFIFFTCNKISDDNSRQLFIVWNVGQGQWTTLVTADECIHFDMGGEHFPINKIKVYCEKKKNFTHLSHSDWDHINGLKKWTKTCLINRPWAKENSKNERLINKVKTCLDKPQIHRQIEILNYPYQFSKFKKNNLNESSQVVYLKKWNILIPGDSTKIAEYDWSKNKIIENTNILILGHHGSKTSTSDFLLEKFNKLNYAIATARFKKYGHPHTEVTEKLKRNKITLLKTEIFGNIIFQLN